MGFILTVEGNETLHYGKNIIRSVHTGLTSPSDSKAKSTNSCVTLLINGKLNVDSGTSMDSETLKLFQWAQIPAGGESAYRKVKVEVQANGQCFRKIELNKAFVVEYNERYNDSAGVGEFSLVLRQKADKTDEVKVDGNLPIGNEADVPDEAEESNAMGYKSGSDVNSRSTSGQKEGLLGTKQPNVLGQAVNNAARSVALGAAQRTLNKIDKSGSTSKVLESAQTSFGKIESEAKVENILEKTKKTL